MKKFRFTLDKMRGYTQQLLDEEKNILARLKQVQFEIEARIENLENSFADISLELQEDERNGIEASALMGYNLQMTNIRNQLKELRIELKKAIRDVDKQLEKVVAASKEVSKLDKLEEKQLEEYQKTVAKGEEIFIDEFVSSDIIRRDVFQ